jgi:hypothetical protein
MTPVARRGNRKVLVVGDMFSRFIMAVAMKDEKAETVARICSRSRQQSSGRQSTCSQTEAVTSPAS